MKYEFEVNGKAVRLRRQDQKMYRLEIDGTYIFFADRELATTAFEAVRRLQRSKTAKKYIKHHEKGHTQ